MKYFTVDKNELGIHYTECILINIINNMGRYKISAPMTHPLNYGGHILVSTMN